MCISREPITRTLCINVCNLTFYVKCGIIYVCVRTLKKENETILGGNLI